MEAPTWGEFLNSVAYGGLGAVISGVFVSILIEYWPWFQTKEQKVKVLVFVGACFVVALAAVALGIATNEFGEWNDVGGTWWPAVYGAFVASGVGTLWHKWSPQLIKVSKQ